MGMAPIHSSADRWFGRANAVLLAVLAVCTLYPLVYMAALSLSAGGAATGGRVWLWPVEWSLAAYQHVAAQKLFWFAYANTVVYTVAGTLTSLALIIPAAYALSKPRLRGRRVMGFFIAFTMWFHAGMVPFYLNLRDMGLLDSRFGIVIAFAVNAFSVILMRNFFESIPRSFEEAAHMDGASDFQVLWKVYIPLAKPAIAAVAMLCAMGRWNGYFWAMVLLKTDEKIPLQVFLKKMIVEMNMTEEAAGVIATQVYSLETLTGAVIVMSLVPVLLAYPFIQRYFTRQMAPGGPEE